MTAPFRGAQEPRVIVIIPTADRPERLARALECWRRGIALPAEVRVVDASSDDRSRRLCARDWGPLNVSYMRAEVRSAAKQRNQGAVGCATELIAFSDDDIEFSTNALDVLLEVFRADTDRAVGGVAATLEGLHHRRPSGLARMYYRAQAGYGHAHYGGRFIGAAITILPTDEADDPLLYPSEWLNAGMVVYRRELFERERFPEFPGYSFQEDASLSARVGRTHGLYFHRGVRYAHENVQVTRAESTRELARMRLANRWHNATDVLRLAGRRRWWKFFLSQLFETAVILRARPASSRELLAGSWGAWWQLSVLGRDPSELR